MLKLLGTIAAIAMFLFGLAGFLDLIASWFYPDKPRLLVFSGWAQSVIDEGIFVILTVLDTIDFTETTVYGEGILDKSSLKYKFVSFSVYAIFLFSSFRILTSVSRGKK